MTSNGAASFAPGSILNLFGSVGMLPELLMTYSGSTPGAFSDVTWGGSNLVGGDLSYSSGSVELLSVVTGPSVWSSTASGNWGTSTNWLGGVLPSGIGAGAVFSGTGSAPVTVTLDTPQTVGTLQFGNSAGPSTSYTLSSSNMLTLNNSTSGSVATVTVLGGTHAIAVPVEISGGSLAVVLSNSGVLSISGDISDDNGAESLTLTGDGTGELILGGTNSYGGGTNVINGTLILEGPEAIAAGSSLTVGNASALLSSQVVAVSAVPEPGALVLLAAALASAAIYRRLRRRDSRRAR